MIRLLLGSPQMDQILNFDDGVDRHHYLGEVNELTQEEWNDSLQI